MRPGDTPVRRPFLCTASYVWRGRRTASFEPGEMLGEFWPKWPASAVSTSRARHSSPSWECEQGGPLLRMLMALNHLAILETRAPTVLAETPSAGWHRSPCRTKHRATGLAPPSRYSNYERFLHRHCKRSSVYSLCTLQCSQ